MAGMLNYKDLKGNWQTLLWPIGSVYSSTKQTSPALIYGGQWTEIKQAVLRGDSKLAANSDNYSGSDTHVLTVGEMPNHRHGMALYFHSDANGTTTNVNRFIWSPKKDSFVGNNNTSFEGGGKHIQLCSALSTFICGIAPSKYSRWS